MEALLNMAKKRRMRRPEYPQSDSGKMLNITQEAMAATILSDDWTQKKIFTT